MPKPIGSLLWRSLRMYQIYGANTDVGKTVITTLLCKGASRLWQDEPTAFLKPISTGPQDEADERHIQKFAPGLETRTLFQYDLAASPHLAARASDTPIPSDESILAKIYHYAALHAAHGRGWLFVETAGGVLSPGPSGTTQADLYRPLRIPVILIGDARLGGISQTISAFESLKCRGYDVETVLLFNDRHLENYLYLTDYFGQNHGIPVWTMVAPPKPVEDLCLDQDNLSRYYNDGSFRPEVRDILEHLDYRHHERIARIESMSRNAHQKIWYPFTQQKHLTPEEISVIDSAHGDYLQTLYLEKTAASEPSQPTSLLRPSFDGSASWWTQGLGHGNHSLALDTAYSVGRYGHVLFPEAIHEPALALAEALLRGMQNPRLTRVFFSDNGSTGTEVAVKMGLRAARLRYGWGVSEKLGVLGLRDSYHGDTIGAMDCVEPGDFNHKVEWYEGKGFWFDYPTVKCTGGKWVVSIPDELKKCLGADTEFNSLADVFDIEARGASDMYEQYEKYVAGVLKGLQACERKFGALMLEPVVLGAGGMRLVDPLFQRTLVEVVRHSPHLFGIAVADTAQSASIPSWSGLPVIFDEVFTGLYRLGRFTASSFLGVQADISVHAKLLTGGVLPLCTTLASESIFNAFQSDEKTDALLHGHSYTAHAAGCQAALSSVLELQRMEKRGDWDWTMSNGGWASGTRQKSDQMLDTAVSKTPDSVHVWSVWGREFVEGLSRQTATIDGIWALGSVLAIHMRSPDGGGYKSNAAGEIRGALYRGEEQKKALQWNVHSRVLGNVLYLMAGQKTRSDDINQIERRLQELLG